MHEHEGLKLVFTGSLIEAEFIKSLLEENGIGAMVRNTMGESLVAGWVSGGPEDAGLVQRFVHDLSEESKYFRFMNSVHELTEAMLVRFTQIDYGREMALIAVATEQGKEIELGVARFAINPDGNSCEFALVVADGIHGKGLGQKLMVALMEAARDKGLSIIEGEVLSNNHKMFKLMTRLGFTVKPGEDDPSIMKVSKQL